MANDNKTAYDNLVNQGMNNPSSLNFGVFFDKKESAKQEQPDLTASMEIIQALYPQPDTKTSVSEGNLFMEATAPLYDGMVKQTIGRTLGDLPTGSDKKIMYRLMDYLPEKSKAMGHAVMANVVNSLRGDQAASQVAAKLLEEKDSFDTKINALQFGIHKLADPTVSDAAKGSIMAALGNTWDDIYGPDKSVKMTQSLGFLSQIGGIMEALLAKAQVGVGQSTMAKYGYGQTEDPIATLTRLSESAASKYQNYAETMHNFYKDVKKATYDEKTDAEYQRLVKEAQEADARLQAAVKKYYGEAPVVTALPTFRPDLGFKE